MSISISSDIGVKPTGISQAKLVSWRSKNGSTVGVKINSETGNSSDVDAYVSRNFSPSTQKLAFGSDIIRMSANSSSPSQIKSNGTAYSGDLERDVLAPKTSEKQRSFLKSQVLTDGGTGKNIDISV